MNTGTYYIASVAASPTADGNLDSFDLEYRYKAGGQAHKLFGVHVPPRLQSALHSGSVQAFSLEALSPNSLARWFLPDTTNFVLLGVTQTAGSEELVTPLRLKLARHLGGLITTAACAGCFFEAVEAHSWVALGLGIAASHVLRSLCSLPHASSFKH